MDKQNILKADYLDIIFDNRNKDYGSYDLRKKYPNRAKRAAVAVLLGMSVIVAIPVVASSLSNEPIVVESTFRKIVEVTDIPLRPKAESKPKELPKPAKSADKLPAPAAPTVIINTPPIIKPTTEVTRETLPVDSMEGKLAGVRNSEGQPGGSSSDNGGRDNTGGNGGGSEGGGSIPEPDVFPEIMPTFDGDLYGYLAKNIHYPQAAIDRGDQGRSILEFVVNEDGSLSDIKIARSAGFSSLDAEAMRVVSSMPKWKPGKTKGRNVRVYFKLPVTFVLD